MINSVLIKFIKAGLIQIGGEDTKFNHLKDTATDLAAVLKKTPSKATAYALIAIDPTAPEDDPAIREVEQALEQRWTTYSNTLAGTPVAVFRAILLEALVMAANEDPRIGVALVGTVRNRLSYMQTGHEVEIWTAAIIQAETILDEQAEAEWATPENISVPAMPMEPIGEIEIQTLTEFEVDKDILTTQIAMAAGPQTTGGVATGGNPHWPQSGQYPWIAEFSTRMAELLADELTNAVHSMQIAPIDLASPLNTLAASVAAHVSDTMNTVSRATAGLQRRTNLIWWKETLYSPSARASYRTLSADLAAGLMALDLHRQVPTFSPASVSAFLYEAVLSLPNTDAGEKRTIRDLLTTTGTSAATEPLRLAAAQAVGATVGTGRGPLLAWIGHRAGTIQHTEEQFQQQFGLSDTIELTMPEWAAWLFRELQAARAVQESESAHTKVKAKAKPKAAAASAAP